MYRSMTMPLADGAEQAVQLQDEITTLEIRLEDMGMDGDCAYERAMSRLYADMVEERKLRLAAMGQAQEP